MYDKIVQLKLESSDGKKYNTDCADVETMLRIIQSIPSKKAELLFTALAELSTRQVAENTNATGMSENKNAAKVGGNIAKRAKEDFEERTGQKVVSEENYLPQKKMKQIESKKGEK